jgi:tRNA pseudouridine65 synthase
MVSSFQAMQHESPDTSIPFAKGVRILHVGKDGLVAIEKPGGLLSTPNTPEDIKHTIVRAKFSKKEEAYVWFDSAQQRRCFYICHRLDSPTSGILIGSTEGALATHIRTLFKTRDIHKTYVAVVVGIPRSQSGSWKDQLETRSEAGGRQVRSQVKSGRAGEPSLTDWRLLHQDARKRLAMLELKPHTGRTHQLRVQSSHHQLPILGDRTYGDFKANALAKKQWGAQRLFLHASRLSIHHKASGLHIDLESPMPAEFGQLFDK